MDVRPGPRREPHLVFSKPLPSQLPTNLATARDALRDGLRGNHCHPRRDVSHARQSGLLYRCRHSPDGLAHG